MHYDEDLHGNDHDVTAHWILIVIFKEGEGEGG
jgi:hypothetical protein